MADNIWPVIHTEREVLADDLTGLSDAQWQTQSLRAAQSRTSTPPGPKESWLGEAFVHGEDIRRPLGLTRNYPTAELTRVIAYHAAATWSSAASAGSPA